MKNEAGTLKDSTEFPHKTKNRKIDPASPDFEQQEKGFLPNVK